MAVTGTYIFSMQAGDYIQDALDQLGVLAIGESPTTDEYALGLRVFNRILKSLKADRKFLTQTFVKTFNTIASDPEYSFTGTGADRITDVFIRQDNTDTDIEVLTKGDYDAILNKSTEDVPQYVYIDYALDTTVETPVMHFYPVPDAIYDIHYTIQRKFDDLDAITDDVPLPQKAQTMLVWLLARELGGPFRAGQVDRQFAEARAELEYNKYIAGDTERDGTEIVAPRMVV